MASTRTAKYNIHPFPLGGLQKAYKLIVRGQKAKSLRDEGWIREISMSGKDVHGGEISQKISSPALEYIDFTALTERLSFDSRVMLQTYDYQRESVSFRKRTHFSTLKDRPYLEIEVTAESESRRNAIEQIVVQELGLTPFNPSGKNILASNVPARLDNTQPITATATIEAPKVFTLKWLWEHLPLSAYLKAGAIITAIAGASFTAGKFTGMNSSHQDDESRPQDQPKPQVEPSASEIPHPPESVTLEPVSQ
jgi:hypothetical protein